eukprot:TRINITY_DN18166_c0_g1_i2.p1 TRINITY_DN18166_c0_g1~~TRINITY_DN18166_c0_g1_i2.p1  ORF type:complete len:1404 (-),score=394.70 TRINITY_DN18166_c0_g1_i2:63-4274(-)
MSSEGTNSVSDGTAIANGNGEDKNVIEKPDAGKEGEVEESEQEKGLEYFFYNLTIHTPRGAKVQIQLSPLDSIQELRQQLFDAPETCDLTSYNLHFKSTDGNTVDNTPLNELVELAEIEGLQQNSELEMTFETYSERSILMHIRRLREITSAYLWDLSNSPSPSVFSFVIPPSKQALLEHVTESTSDASKKPAAGSNSTNNKKNKKKNKNKANNNANGTEETVNNNTTNADVEEFVIDERVELAETESTSLSRFYPTSAHERSGASSNEQNFLKEIRFSGWNSPPKSRQLLGDLVYLEVVTNEKQTFHITGWTGGFYVNNSTHTTFDPRPNPKKANRSHSLADLLAKLSPHFKSQFFRTVRVPGLDKEIHLVGGPNFLGIGGDINGKHPYEVLPSNTSLVSWCGVREERHLYDINRAEYAILEADTGDQSGNMRDWNEEWQRCKELPKHTIQERIVRDRNLQKVHADFVASVERGAVAIVNKSIPPINGGSDERTHMYIYNNIFFSYVNSQGLVVANPEDTVKPASAPANARSEKQERGTRNQSVQGAGAQQDDGDDDIVVDGYHSANNDLRGIQLANAVDADGISTLLTAVIDYKGFRLIAQSLIPGVLATETMNIIYGSLDSGSTIHSDPEFHESVKKLAARLGLAEHDVIATGTNEEAQEGEQNQQQGESVNNTNENDSQEKKPVSKVAKTCLAVDTKGILGTDSRTYLVDLVRLTPRDPNYLNTEDAQSTEKLYYNNYILRRELIDSFGKWIVLDRSLRADQVREQLGIADLKRPAPQATPAAAGTPTPPAQPSGEASPTNANPQPVAPVDAIQQGLLQFNLNVFTEHHYGPEKKKEREEWVVKELGKYLTEVVIPRLVDEFALYGPSAPIDGDVLRTFMHRKGINMRYLGAIATLCRQKGRTGIAELCEQEMYVRAAKHHFYEFLRTESRATGESSGHISPVVSHFLNCLVSDSGRHDKETLPLNGSGSGSNDKYRVNNRPSFALSSASLWKSCVEDIKRKYKYTLPGDKNSKMRNVQVLRSFCQKCGVQIKSRDYKISENSTVREPFTPDDISDIFPVIKTINPKTGDGQELTEVGSQCLAKMRLDLAYEVFSECLGVFHQVYGPLHADTAACYSNLALVLFHASDYAQAIANQKKMVIISERVLGLDHLETIQGYGTLALYYQAAGRHREALCAMKRNYYLTKLVTGNLHPDFAAVLANLGATYQELGSPTLSLHFQQEALKCNELFYGPNHMQTANSCHNVAIAYDALEKYKEATAYEKRNYQIIVSMVGASDYRAVESSVWLKQMAAKAAQQESQIQTQKVRVAAATQKEPRGNITSKLSQEKFDRLRSLKGGAGDVPAGDLSHLRPKFGARTGPVAGGGIGEKNLDEVLAFINGTEGEGKGKGKKGKGGKKQK